MRRRETQLRRAAGLTIAALAAAAGLAVVISVLASGPSGQASRPPHAVPPTVESVPWHLAYASGRHVTARWSSGTCDPSLRPQPRIKLVETSSSVMLTVLARVVKEGGNDICAGVGLGGTLSTTLAQPIADRPIAHGKVTDHDM